MPLAIVPIVPLLGVDGSLPIFSLVMSLVLFCYVRHERDKSIQRCAVFPYIAARILLVFTMFSAIVAAVSIASGHSLGGPLLEALRSHTSLYLSLFSLVIMKLMYPKMWNTVFCSDCLLRHGMPQERNCLGHTYVKENGYLVQRQQRLFAGIFLLTVSFRMLEAFFSFSPFVVRSAYVYLPLSLIVVDAVVVRSRYFVVGRLKEQKDREIMPFGGRFKLVRVLVFDNDGVLLAGIDGGKDTPVSCYEPYSEPLSVGTARRLADNAVDGPKTVRFCYSTLDPINCRSIEHYLCFIDNRGEKKVKGEWVDRDSLERMYDAGMGHLLRAEMFRIYTVMRTSKMFDIDGKKKIDLKGYVPKFNFSELRTTDVDFNDVRWLLLSKFNKDLMFYSLRKAWYQYVEGLI